eukprot:1009470-Prymnesium_polylepis.1
MSMHERNELPLATRSTEHMSHTGYPRHAHEGTKRECTCIFRLRGTNAIRYFAMDCDAPLSRSKAGQRQAIA